VLAGVVTDTHSHLAHGSFSAGFNAESSSGWGLSSKRALKSFRHCPTLIEHLGQILLDSTLRHIQISDAHNEHPWQQNEPEHDHT
jgi:hypothetical protein